ncbi:hypothetical protein PspLS_06536 [Pyricularia sp. CBS 133598]|nr:hypothetical protein PspLS_06536 [Pyricularia sp. CBS 133598]
MAGAKALHGIELRGDAGSRGNFLNWKMQHHTNTGTIRTNRAADHFKNPRRAFIVQDLHEGLLCDETNLARFPGCNGL